jgi:hypothetical protein
MKKLFLLVALASLSSNTSFGQHSLSITGGWTFSTLYKIGTPTAFEHHYYYSDLFDFSLIHFPNFNLKYNYNAQAFRFSTGLSFLSIGTRDYFWKGTRWAYLYLTVPVLVGRRFKFSKHHSLALEGGIEAGTSVMMVGDLVNAAKFKETLPYVGLILNIENSYKRFIFGIRGHLGLNNFDYYVFSTPQETIYFKHISGTVYIGYTFWDSHKAKIRRQQRAKKS